MKIAVIGDIGVDYYENLNILRPGGIAFNFAYSLVKSDKNIKVSIIAPRGSDTNSKKLLKIIKNLKINYSHIKEIKGTIPKQNIFLEKNGERKFTGYDAGVLKKWKLSQNDIDFICKHDALFVPLSDGMEHIFEKIKRLKCDIVKAVDFSQDYEFADFDKKDNIITKNAIYFDVIFVGGKKKHQKMVRTLSKKYVEKIFVLTLGKGGSQAFYQDEEYYEPAKKVKVVDATGAGDAFQAGFLYSWLSKQNVKTALKVGTKTASAIIKHVGSTPLILK